jgi:hypothetical protein
VFMRFAYLSVSRGFAALRLFAMSDREKDVEILALRHQLTVLQRQLGGERPRFRPEDRAFLAALLSGLPWQALRRIRLVVSPDTVLRWHRDLIRRRHCACRECHPPSSEADGGTARGSPLLLRLAYLAVTHAFAAVRLLPMSDREKDVEILVLRHQVAVLDRQLGGRKVTFTP